MTINKKKNTVVNIRMSNDTKDKLSQLANDNETTMSEIIRYLVEKEFLNDTRQMD